MFDQLHNSIPPENLLYISYILSSISFFLSETIGTWNKYNIHLQQNVGNNTASANNNFVLSSSWCELFEYGRVLRRPNLIHLLNACLQIVYSDKNSTTVDDQTGAPPSSTRSSVARSPLIVQLLPPVCRYCTMPVYDDDDDDDFSQDCSHLKVSWGYFGCRRR